MPTSVMNKLRQALAGKSPKTPRYNPPPQAKPGDRRGKSLAVIAKETIEILPGIMEELSHLDATASKKYDLLRDDRDKRGSTKR